MNGTDNSVNNLKRFDISLNLATTNPDTYCLDTNLNMSRTKDCKEKATSKAVLHKISTLFFDITQNHKITSITTEKWKDIFEHVEAFAKKADSEEISGLCDSILKPMRNKVLCDDYDYQIDALLATDVENFTIPDIEKSIKILSTIHSEFQTTNKMVIQLALMSLEYLFGLEFEKKGGKLVPCERFSQGLRISWDDIPIDSPQGASIALNLQTLLQKSDNNNLFKSLANYITNKECLELDSKKTIEVWQLYLASCLLGSSKTIMIDNLNKDSYFRAHTDDMPEQFLSCELQKVYKRFLDMVKNPKFDQLIHLRSREAVQFCKDQLEDINTLLQDYIAKKEYLDKIYAIIHNKTISALVQQRNMIATQIKNFSDFKLLPTPKDFIKSQVYNINFHHVQQFFRQTLLPQLSLPFTSSQNQFMRIILTTLFSLDENSPEFISFELFFKNSYLKKSELNIPYYLHIKQLVIKEIQRLAEIKLCELELIHNIADQKDTIESPDILFALSKMSQLSLLDKKNTPENQLSIYDHIRQSAYTQLSQRSQENSEFGRELAKLRLMIETTNESTIPSIISSIAGLERGNRNNITMQLNELYISLFDLQVIESDFREKMKREVPLELEHFSKEKEADSDIDKTRPQPKKIVPQRKERSKRRRRPHRKSEEVTEKEPEKEKEKPSLISNEQIFPLPEHQLFSQREIYFDSRVRDWFDQSHIPLSKSSYASLPKQQQKQQKIFHSYPSFITKIALIWGEKSSWTSEHSKEKKPHYAILGQIQRYKPGKQATYTGVFTDCFDPKNPNLLFHHYFSPRTFNSSIDDLAKGSSFQPNKELENASQIRNTKEDKKHAFLDKTGRFKIEQTPGLVQIDDTEKQICYTVILKSS